MKHRPANCKQRFQLDQVKSQCRFTSRAVFSHVNDLQWLPPLEWLCTPPLQRARYTEVHSKAAQQWGALSKRLLFLKYFTQKCAWRHDNSHFLFHKCELTVFQGIMTSAISEKNFERKHDLQSLLLVNKTGFERRLTLSYRERPSSLCSLKC